MKTTLMFRIITALVWALAAGSAVYWGLRFGQRGEKLDLPPQEAAAPALVQATGEASPVPQFLSGPPVAAPAVATAPPSNRFALIGVVAGKQGGAALIAVDGKPARPFRVGSKIDDATFLRSVGPRHAVLAASMAGPDTARLDMPVPVAAPINP